MATKKKKRSKPRKVTHKKKASKKPAAKEKAPSKKKAVRKKVVTKKKAPGKSPGKRKTAAKTRRVPKKKARSRGRRAESPVLRPQGGRARAGGQSGDLQGLSDVRGADSESVDELLEEGNAFEADVVQGVEDAGNQPGREVHTHEVPEDDIPQEYLDED